MAKKKELKRKGRASSNRKTQDENYLPNKQKKYSVKQKKCCENEQVEDNSVNGKVIKDNQKIL